MPAPLLLALTAAAAVSAALHIRAEYRGPRAVVYLCKPLTTTLLLVLALSAAPAEPRYRAAVAVGLGLSLVGDICLMLPQDRFVAGLVSFLLAHLAYLAAFTTGTPLGTTPWLLAPVALAGAVIVRLLWPRLGPMRVPVLAYVAVIVTMTWQASARAWTIQSPLALAAAAGAVLFMVSDAVLAVNRFHTAFRSAQAVIMASYVAAQWLIARSVG